MTRNGRLPSFRHLGSIALVALLVVSSLPFSVAGYPGAVSAFDDPPAPQPLGTVNLPSNATVLSASAVLSGSPRSLQLNYTYNVSAGFPAATLSGLGLSPVGVNGTSVSGFVEFRGTGLFSDQIVVVARLAGKKEAGHAVIRQG